MICMLTRHLGSRRACVEPITSRAMINIFCPSNARAWPHRFVDDLPLMRRPAPASPTSKFKPTTIGYVSGSLSLGDSDVTSPPDRCLIGNGNRHPVHSVFVELWDGQERNAGQQGCDPHQRWQHSGLRYRVCPQRSRQPGFHLQFVVW
jgi:hypothetical protein